MKKCCVYLSLFISVVLLSFLLLPINTKADEPEVIDIVAGMYDPENHVLVIEPGNYYDGKYHFFDEENQANNYEGAIRNITIPTDCCLIIDGFDLDFAFSFSGNLVMEENSRIEVLTHGKNVSITKTGSGTVTAGNDAVVWTDNFEGSGVSFITGERNTICQYNGVTPVNNDFEDFNIRNIGSTTEHPDVLWAIDNFPFGDPRIVDEVKNKIYAYSSNDTNVLRDMLEEELYNRYVGDTHFYDFQYDGDAFSGSVQFIEQKPSINVVDNDGNVQTRNVYSYRVFWGFPEGRDENNYPFPDFSQPPVESEISVIALNPGEIIVCTDYNNETGSGSKYYVRTIHGDTKLFAPNSGFQGSEYFEEYLIADASYTNVVVAGNALDSYLITTDGLVAISFYSNVNATPENSFSGILRVINPSETYVAVIQEGEPNKYGGLGNNGLSTENIFRTGNDAVAITYIGNTTLHLEPLNDGLSLNTRLITNVELKDSTQKDGVAINKSDLNDVKVTFRSNFYDSVTLVITYEGGITKELTIQRVGLVVQYMYLMEDGSSFLIMDHNHQNLDFNYNYDSGEQIVIYATYYHPTNYVTKSGDDNLFLNVTYANGTSKIISHTDSARNFNGYCPMDGGAVASTTFIIGFTTAGQTDIHVDPFYATVVNGGFNDTNTYGGTQTGSGKGVYWDGHLIWNY